MKTSEIYDKVLKPVPVPMEVECTIRFVGEETPEDLDDYWRVMEVLEPSKKKAKTVVELFLPSIHTLRKLIRVRYTTSFFFSFILFVIMYISLIQLKKNYYDAVFFLCYLFFILCLLFFSSFFFSHDFFYLFVLLYFLILLMLLFSVWCHAI